MTDPSQHHPSVIRFDERNIRRITISVLLLITLFQILFWAAGRVSTFAFELLLAWLLAISLEPPIAALTNRGWNRRWAASVAFFGFLTAAIGLAVLFGRLFLQQVSSAISGLPKVVISITDWLNKSFNLDLDGNALGEKLSFEQMASVAGDLAGGVLNVIAGFSAAFVGLTIVLVFAFFMAAEAPTMRRVIAARLKPSHQQVFLMVWNLTVIKTGGFVLSRMILATISSTAHSIAFALIGVPYWLPLGLLMGVVSSFLPVVGTYLGLGAPVFFAFSEEPLLAAWVLGFAIFYQQIENYWLSPRATRATLDLHPAVSIGSVILGVALFGPLAAFISIPLAAAAIAIVQTYLHRYELVPELHDLEDAEADTASE